MSVLKETLFLVTKALLTVDIDYISPNMLL